MKISVIVPNYNAEKTIRETLKSVVEQKREFPSSVELIVVDGASTDQSINIINEFDAEIDVLISEEDSGQYDAISKGFSRASGDILCWINSDDLLLPWSIKFALEFFKTNEGVNWIMGLPSFITSKGYYYNYSNKHIPCYRWAIKRGWHNGRVLPFLQQESMFWRRDLYEHVGGLSANLELAADFDLWVRFAGVDSLVLVDLPMGCFRIDPSVQRSAIYFDKYEEEVERVCFSKSYFSWLLFILSGVQPWIARFFRFLMFGVGQEYVIRADQSVSRKFFVGNFSRLSFRSFLSRGRGK